MEDKQIRVVLLKPKQRAEVLVIRNTLTALQELVGGYIEVITDRVEHRNFQALLIVNEEGKLIGLEPNIGSGYDVLVGNIVICAAAGEEFSSLSVKQAELICKAYDYKRGLLKGKSR